jgi:pimeloyl-ACP methyl ester carboxylesterase
MIWGELDAFVPRSDQDAMLAAIPCPTLHALAGTGHAVHWDRPGETAAIIKSLMLDVARRKAA